MVLQETILFIRTLKKNILYANLNAEDEDIVKAIKAANVYGFYKSY